MKIARGCETLWPSSISGLHVTSMTIHTVASTESYQKVHTTPPRDSLLSCRTNLKAKSVVNLKSNGATVSRETAGRRDLQRWKRIGVWHYYVSLGKSSKKFQLHLWHFLCGVSWLLIDRARQHKYGNTSVRLDSDIFSHSSHRHISLALKPDTITVSNGNLNQKFVAAP